MVRKAFPGELSCEQGVQVHLDRQVRQGWESQGRLITAPGPQAQNPQVGCAKTQGGPGQRRVGLPQTPWYFLQSPALLQGDNQF